MSAKRGSNCKEWEKVGSQLTLIPGILPRMGYVCPVPHVSGPFARHWKGALNATEQRVNRTLEL